MNYDEVAPGDQAGEPTPLGELMDEERRMVKVGYLLDYFKDFEDLQSFRQILRDWYTHYTHQQQATRCDHRDLVLFQGLDEMLAELQSANYHDLHKDNKNKI